MKPPDTKGTGGRIAVHGGPLFSPWVYGAVFLVLGVFAILFVRESINVHKQRKVDYLRLCKSAGNSAEECELRYFEVFQGGVD